MKLVIQRVRQASVLAEGRTVGAIGQGLLVLIGIADTDTEETADKYVRKLLGLRIFEDEEGKTNRSLRDVGGSLLLVSQFTLYADCRKGNRPSFTRAGQPKMAQKLYEYIIDACRKEGVPVEQGIFGAEMEVSLINHGPFTIVLDESLFDKQRAQ